MTKVFCIGANKTGTTSLNEFFRVHGYRVGEQPLAELLFVKCARADRWDELTEFVRTADFFQDLPFSARHTYRHLSDAFPKSLFLLSTRSSAEEWYNSLIAFHAAKFGDGLHPPTKAQLKAATYRYPGFAWEANRLLYSSPEEDPYRKDNLIQWYTTHLYEARTWFAERPGRMLEINIAHHEAAQTIADFAGFELRMPALPHLNKGAA